MTFILLPHLRMVAPLRGVYVRKNAVAGNRKSSFKPYQYKTKRNCRTEVRTIHVGEYEKYTGSTRSLIF